ncbi:MULTISPECIES: RNA polymerase sigma factor [Sphingomonas]|uniref:RNA polymerase sigma factor n=1 Tax=Sphingomonas lycopersici TaxID=2951807 RepID=A0AA41ZBF1_9SPHN|nr:MULTISPECIES: RNA polymerase sigma factor [unclassified Sphingomonas]MCW6532158.1 RNA polymerase sigma factor [Sphingomonas lycopersici]MCW6536232.1 RNA polymerase sigma factor [Sphingomonas lycopersici]OJU23615.1 MAG: RNA polymerase subunit sigma-24 [Sphingomonas sp. 66-10]
MTLDLDGCSDGELAALALGGRQAAYGELMRRHRDAVFRLLRGHTGDADAAVDLTQQGFIAAFAALRSYDGARPFRLWIARIAINKAHDWNRRRAVRRLLTFARPIDEAVGVADPGIPADVQIDDRRALERTMRAIATLPVNLRDVLVLRTIEGMSQAESAAVLAISEKAVETRLYRARAKLMEMLRD